MPTLSNNIDLGKIRFHWRGTYDAATTYDKDDVVEYLGASYICLNDGTTGSTPESTSSNWDVMAQGGDVGATLTNTGDMLYRDGNGLQRVGIGSSGQYLSTNGTEPQWANLTQPDDLASSDYNSMNRYNDGQELIRRAAWEWGGGTWTANTSWNWANGLFENYTPRSGTSRIEMRGYFSWGGGWDGGNSNPIGWGYPAISDPNGANIDWFSRSGYYFGFESHTGGTGNYGGRPGAFMAMRNSWGAGVEKRIGLQVRCYDNSNYRIRFHRTNWNAPGSGSDLSCRAHFIVEEYE